MNAKILDLKDVCQLNHLDDVYVEIWGMNRKGYFLCRNRTKHMIRFSLQLFHVGAGGRYRKVFSFPERTYGSNWRCWSSEPTKEQMRSTGWEPYVDRIYCG